MLIDISKITHSHGSKRKPKMKMSHFKKYSDVPKPYGDVAYADPADGKYPIDTPEHIRAAWNYINKPHNASLLSNASAVKAKIISAWKKKIDPAGPPSIQKIFLGDIFKGGPWSGPHNKGDYVRTKDGRHGKVLRAKDGKVTVHFPKVNENGRTFESHDANTVSQSSRANYMKDLLRD